MKTTENNHEETMSVRAESTVEAIEMDKRYPVTYVKIKGKWMVATGQQKLMESNFDTMEEARTALEKAVKGINLNVIANFVLGLAQITNQWNRSQQSAQE